MFKGRRGPLGFLFGFQGRFMRAEHSWHSMGMSTAVSVCVHKCWNC
jgi:hypothetical protein